MARVVLAVLVVLAIVAVGGLLRLPARTVRFARGLIRHTPAPARLTAG